MLFKSALSWLPALLLALFAFYSGTFAGTGFLQVLLGTVGLLLFSLLGWPYWRRPLGPGPALRLLPLALLVAVFGSWWASPVPRAGTTALVLLPVYLILPAAFAHCWSSPAARRTGLKLLMIVVAAIATAALVGYLILEDPRPAWPIGHHNLLAGFLLLLLPLLLPILREGRFWRFAGGFTGLLGVLALLLTRSLSGLLGLVAVAIFLCSGPKRRWARTAIVILFAVVALPRLVAISEGRDSSFESRRIYMEGAWRGISERPALGWGPASSAWTLALHVKPRPGVNPAGEIVSQAHNLPLRVVYEIGIGGALIALSLGIALWRQATREVGIEGDAELARGARASLAGFALWSLGGASLEVNAIPLALALVVGASLAAVGQEIAPKRGPWWLALVLAVALLPGLAGHADWDRASRGEADRASLERAVRRDGAFPLYRSRWALSTVDGKAAADELLQAARAVPGSPVLWMRAGEAGREAGSPWAADALARACRLDPLAPFAPFLLFLAEPDHPDAVDSAARALLAEPRLAAASVWVDHRPLFDEAVLRLESWPGVDPGWRAEAVELMRTLPGEGGSLGRLRLREDVKQPTSSSIFVFRRRPWPLEIVAVDVDLARAAHLDLPPAFALSTTTAEALQAGCR